MHDASHPHPTLRASGVKDWTIECPLKGEEKH